mgnify:CR=1 FL=1
MPKHKKIMSIISLLSIALPLASCDKPNTDKVVIDDSTVSEDESVLNSIVFNSKTFTYDGMSHTLEATNIPDGILVSYTGNNKTEPGEWNVTATFINQKTGYEYKTVKTAVMNIIDSGASDSGLATSDPKLSKVVFSDRNIEYTGKAPKVSVDNLPTGYSVNYTAVKITTDSEFDKGQVSLDEIKDVGNYIVYARISSPSGNVFNKSSILRITARKLTISNVYLRNASYPYNGSIRSLKLTDYNGNAALETDGTLKRSVSVSGQQLQTISGAYDSDLQAGKVNVVGTYSNNGKVEAGQYVVTVSFTVYEDANHNVVNKNYEITSPISGTLTIIDAMSHTVTFVNAKGRVLKTVENVMDGSSIDDSVVPEYIPSNPTAYKKIYNTASLTNIREDKMITVTYEPTIFSIKYIIPRGLNSSSNPSSYTYEDEDITLEMPNMDKGYAFKYFYYLDELNNEVIVEKINKNSVGNYILFAKVEALNGEDSTVTLRDKFTEYTGEEITADVLAPEEADYTVYYTGSDGKETTKAPTAVGSYSVRVEVRGVDSATSYPIQYKDLLGLLVIYKQQIVIDSSDIKAFSDRGREEIFKDSNNVFSLIKEGMLTKSREYEENKPVYISLNNVPDYLEYTVTYTDYEGFTYTDGVTNAGTYIARISFKTRDSNYDVPADIYEQIIIAKKKVTLSEDVLKDTLFPDVTETYIEGNTYTKEANGVDNNGYFKDYPEFRVLKYENNSVVGTTGENNYASIYIGASNSNYEVALASGTNRYTLVTDYSTGLPCLKYDALFRVVTPTNVRKVTYIYQDTSNNYQIEANNISASVDNRAPSIEVTEDLYKKTSIYNANTLVPFIWYDFDWILATKTGNTYKAVSPEVSVKDYIVQNSDGELYFILKATLLTATIKWVDETGLVDQTTLNYLNNTHGKLSHDQVTMNIGQWVGYNDPTISQFNNVENEFLYYYTDRNNPAGSKLANQLDKTVIKEPRVDTTIYLYARKRDYTGGYKVNYKVITGDQIQYVGGQIANLDTSFSGYDTIYVGKDTNFKVYSDPSKDGKRFKGWYVLDANGKLSVLVNSNLVLKDEIVKNNVNKNGSGENTINVYGVFEDEEYNLTLDFLNGNTLSLTAKYDQGFVDAVNARNQIATYVKNNCPTGYKADISTVSFLDSTGAKINIMDIAFRYRYIKDVILTVKYQPRTMDFDFILPATDRNGEAEKKVQTITQKHGDHFLLPTNVYREGYTVEKWQMNVNGNLVDVVSNSIVDLSLFGESVTKVEIRAVFKLNTYKISVVTSGDEPVSTSTISYGDNFNVDTYFTAPVKAGYVFQDWYIGNTRLKDLVRNYKFTFTSDIVVYAHYRAKKYNLKFYNGNSELTSLTNYFAQYGKTFDLPEDNGMVVGKTLEGYYLDRDFKYRITSSVLCADNIDADFLPSNYADQATIYLYAKFTPKKYNMTLVMENYTDPITLKEFKTETVQIEYGVSGNLYKYLMDNYAELNKYSGPYTAGKVFKSWNIGNQILDMSDTNLTYNYSYDVVITCQYTGKSLGTADYYWLSQNASKGQVYSGRYDPKTISGKEAFYGASIKTVTLTDTDAKNKMLDALKVKSSTASYSDSYISAWYYLKEGQIVDPNAPIDLTQWVLTDSDTAITNSTSLTLLCVFTRPSYPITIFDKEQNQQISYTTSDLTSASSFAIHNSTPYNIEMEQVTGNDGLITYKYKFYEMLFDESGNRLPNQTYITFEIKENKDYNFDGRTFQVTSSENGNPIKWSLRKIENTNNRYQLTGDYQTISELLNANLSYTNGFSDASNIIISPVVTKKNSVSVKFFALDKAGNSEIYSHSSIIKGNSYTLPNDIPESYDGRVFAGWYLWTKDSDPTAADFILTDKDNVFKPGGQFNTYDTSDTITYIAKYEYSSVYISYKINNNAIMDFTVDGQKDLIIDKFADTTTTLTLRTQKLDHYKYYYYNIVDANGNILIANILAGDSNKTAIAGEKTSLTYGEILKLNQSRLYIVPAESSNPDRQPEYTGMIIRYKIHYYDTGFGVNSSYDVDNGNVVLYGPFLVDKEDGLSKATDANGNEYEYLPLYNPYKNSTFDGLDSYGYVIAYKLADNNYLTDYQLKKADLETLGDDVLLEGYHVYQEKAEKSTLKNDPGFQFEYNDNWDWYSREETKSETIGGWGVRYNDNISKQVDNLLIPSYFVKKDNASIEKVTVIGRCSKFTPTSIKMGNTITLIAIAAFNIANSNLKTVVFSQNLTIIGENAFHSQKNIISLSFPASLKTIESGAFVDAIGLESVTFNKNLETIGTSAFEITDEKTTTKLKTLKFGKNLKKIGDYAFLNRKDLEKVYWDELDNVDYLDFNKYDASSDITITNSDMKYIDGAQVTIGNYAFRLKTDGGNLRGINTRIILPRNLKSIGDFCFADRWLTDVVFTDPYNTAYEKDDRNWPELTIGNNAFNSYCSGGTVLTSTDYQSETFKAFNKTIHIPVNTTSIGEQAFANTLLYHKGISFYNVDIDVKNKYSLTIGKQAFAMLLTKGDGSMLTENLEKVRDEKFWQLVLPARTTTIGVKAFYNVLDIGSNNQKKSGIILSYDIYNSRLKTIGDQAFAINVDTGETATYRNPDIENTTTVATAMNYNNITIPVSLETIGKAAFVNRGSIKEITIFGGYNDGNISLLKTIGSFAFSYCVNLSKINNGFSDSLTDLGEYAFTHCESLTGNYKDKTAIYFGKGLTEIERGVFTYTGVKAKSSDKLDIVFASYCLKRIDSYAFYKSNVTNIYVNNIKGYLGTTYQIGDFAFAYTSKLQNVVTDTDFCRNGYYRTDRQNKGNYSSTDTSASARTIVDDMSIYGYIGNEDVSVNVPESTKLEKYTFTDNAAGIDLTGFFVDDNDIYDKNVRTRGTIFNSGAEIGNKIMPTSGNVEIDKMELWGGDGNTNNVGDLGDASSSTYDIKCNYKIYKRGSQIGVGAFMSTNANFSYNYSNHGATKLYCVNPYTFANAQNAFVAVKLDESSSKNSRTDSLDINVGQTSVNNTIDRILPKIFNLPDNWVNSSNQASRPKDDRSTIATYAFKDTDAYAGGMQVMFDGNSAGNYCYALCFYTSDIEPYGLAGIRLLQKYTIFDPIANSYSILRENGGDWNKGRHYVTTNEFTGETGGGKKTNRGGADLVSMDATNPNSSVLLTSLTGVATNQYEWSLSYKDVRDINNSESFTNYVNSAEDKPIKGSYKNGVGYICNGTGSAEPFAMSGIRTGYAYMPPNKRVTLDSNCRIKKFKSFSFYDTPSLLISSGSARDRRNTEWNGYTGTVLDYDEYVYSGAFYNNRNILRLVLSMDVQMYDFAIWGTRIETRNGRKFQSLTTEKQNRDNTALDRKALGLMTYEPYHDQVAGMIRIFALFSGRSCYYTGSTSEDSLKKIMNQPDVSGNKTYAPYLFQKGGDNKGATQIFMPYGTYEYTEGWECDAYDFSRYQNRWGYTTCSKFSTIRTFVSSDDEIYDMKENQKARNGANGKSSA